MFIVVKIWCSFAIQVQGFGWVHTVDVLWNVSLFKFLSTRTLPVQCYFSIYSENVPN